MLLHSPSDDDTDNVVPPLAMREAARDVGMAEEWGSDVELPPPVSSLRFDRLFVDVDTVEAKPVNGRPPLPDDDDDAAKENNDEDGGMGADIMEGGRSEQVQVRS